MNTGNTQYDLQLKKCSFNILLVEIQIYGNFLEGIVVTFTQIIKYQYSLTQLFHFKNTP